MMLSWAKISEPFCRKICFQALIVSQCIPYALATWTVVLSPTSNSVTTWDLTPLSIGLTSLPPLGSLYDLALAKGGQLCTLPTGATFWVCFRQRYMYLASASVI
jgi:hypothetical protein